MNYKTIRKTTTISAIGYFILVIYSFITLYRVPGLNFLTYLYFLIFPGYIVLTIAAAISRKDSNYFKTAFITFLCLDFLLAIDLVIALISVLTKTGIEDALSMTSQIIEAFAAVGLAVSNRLMSSGLKDCFTKLKCQKMANYSAIMSFCVSKLVLLSMSLPLINLSKFSDMLITIFALIIDLGFQLSYFVFMIISNKVIKAKTENKTLK